MNRIAFVLLAGAVMLLPSCVKEQFGSEKFTAFNDDEVAFRLGSVVTKSGETPKSEVLEIATVNVGEGHSLFLQDEVTSLDGAYAAPATKGTPAFTENVASVHGTFSVVSLKEDKSAAFAAPDNGEVVFEQMTEDPAVWHHVYGQDIWEGKLPTYFFMRMPVEQTGVTLADDPYDITDGSISFSYKSPSASADSTDGKKLQDILFSAFKRTEKENGEPITFYHALTGVKFANHLHYGAESGAWASAETIITSIKVEGLKDEGDCKVTPYVIDNDGVLTYVDNSDAAVDWSNVTGNATYTQKIAYDFADYGKTGSKLKGTPLDDANNPASQQNLNDDDGSLTFWFIPQTLTENVKITIVFNVSLKVGDNEVEKTFEDVVLTVKLTDKLDAAHLTWKPGELHTFRLWPTAVGVDITDKLEGATKSNVVVRNTGNTKSYIRVNIVGNWVGKVQKSAKTTDVSGPTILMGYTSNDANNETEVDPWNDKDGYTSYGTFVNLVAKSTTDNPQSWDEQHQPLDCNWVRFDKYFYYTQAIGPNNAITDPIFTSYTVGASPEFWIVDIMGVRRKAQDVHLEMDLMVEAIEAPTDPEGNLQILDGGDGSKNYMYAWANALGVPVSGLDDLK